MTAALTLPGAEPRVRLNVLSNSAIACYRACPRQFKFRYLLKRRPRRSSEALRFGSFFHVGLNAWWITMGDAGDKFAAAIAAMRTRAEKRSEDADPFDLVRAEELMLGYSARWGEESYETIAVERTFDVPLINPATGFASTKYRVQGAIDVIARRAGRIIHVEHKTTSSDLSPGADYWRKVSALDPQVSTYQSALKSLGLEAAETLYDVVRKVDLRPFFETSDEAKRYTKGKTRRCLFCAKAGNPPGVHVVEEGLRCDGAGTVVIEPPRLDSRQHDHDETPEEFRERVREHITANPERYFARGPIVRLETDEAEHAKDVWQTAAMMRMSENADSFPRNPGACERFHRLCDYFDVCSGNASIDNDSRFRTAESPHEELLKEV